MDARRLFCDFEDPEIIAWTGEILAPHHFDPLLAKNASMWISSSLLLIPLLTPSQLVLGKLITPPTAPHAMQNPLVNRLSSLPIPAPTLLNHIAIPGIPLQIIDVPAAINNTLEKQTQNLLPLISYL
jgi:hypothetical protein